MGWCTPLSLVVRSVLVTAVLVGVADGAVLEARASSGASIAVPATLTRISLPRPLAPVSSTAPAEGARPSESPSSGVGISVESAVAVPTSSPIASASAAVQTATPTPAAQRPAAQRPAPVASPPQLVPAPTAAATPSTSQVVVSAPAPAAALVRPSCAYADVLVTDTGYDNWAGVVLDTTAMLPDTYAPPDLRATGLKGGGSVRGFVIADLHQMAAAAAESGAPLQVVSAYRSYNTQVSTFKHWVGVGGYKQALLSSARAGHSEHQLGTALDFTSSGGQAPWLYNDWATTKAGAWLRSNAWKYGFVSSYPKGKTSVTCYAYEPWHYRYFGKERAAAIHESGLTSREWLLANG